VIDDPGAPDHGLFARDEGRQGAGLRTGVPASDRPPPRPGVKPDLKGQFTLPTGARRAGLRDAGENISIPLCARSGRRALRASRRRSIARLAAELAACRLRGEIVIERPWTD
jgi:hypothetical protein